MFSVYSAILMLPNDTRFDWAGNQSPWCILRTGAWVSVMPPYHFQKVWPTRAASGLKDYITVLVWAFISYQRPTIWGGSLQQGHLSHKSINKTSSAVAFVLLQTSHESMKECISPLCTLLYKASCLWDFTLGLKIRTGKTCFPVTIPEENSFHIAHQNHRVCRKSSSQWICLGRQNISCTE